MEALVARAEALRRKMGALREKRLVHGWVEAVEREAEAYHCGVEALRCLADAELFLVRRSEVE